MCHVSPHTQVGTECMQRAIAALESRRGLARQRAAVLFLFRKIYAEVVGALPLNGGAYNALLNTTSKRAASVAACLTVLSYMATAVISALEGMHYVHNLWHGLDVMMGTIAQI